MNRKMTLLIAAAGSLVAALAVAGTGVSATKDSGYPPSYGAYGSAPRAAVTSAVVGVARARLGRILVDGRGRTLYLFERDKGVTSTCYGPCASIWPPLTTTHKPHAVRGALGARLGTTRRTDGKVEVTYNGYPLYRYVGDAKPGDTKGQDLNQFGGGWYVLSAVGKKIERGGS
jgi:predicted lipoprotein with Yx(FWY)xxD motif